MLKNFIAEFRQFAIKGNMIDLAVGVVIGAVFNSVISSIVDDIIMPVLGLVVGRVDFSNLYINLSGGQYETLQAAEAAGAPILKYGQLVNALTVFLLTALAVFLVVRLINRIRSQETGRPDESPSTYVCPFCVKEISRRASRCPFCTSRVDELT